MAQYKKDRIKEKIDISALSVFAEKGYKETKILEISERASISVGNIYRYYKSKKEIFYTVVPENFLISIKNLLKRKIVASNNKALDINNYSSEFWLLNNDIIEFMVENREAMLIIFKNNKGTIYENTREELVEFIIQTIYESYKEVHNENLEKNNPKFVLKIIYENLINMVIDILEEMESIGEVKKYLGYINSYHMFGITKVFEE